MLVVRINTFMLMFTAYFTYILVTSYYYCYYHSRHCYCRNPFVMGAALCGPALCAKIFCCLLCMAFIALMIFCQPFLNIIINLIFVVY